jgi:hypothetical protein
MKSNIIRCTGSWYYDFYECPSTLWLTLLGLFSTQGNDLGFRLILIKSDSHEE